MLVALGVVLLVADLSFASFAPIATAAMGAILVGLGLSRRA